MCVDIVNKADVVMYFTDNFTARAWLRAGIISKNQQRNRSPDLY